MKESGYNLVIAELKSLTGAAPGQAWEALPSIFTVSLRNAENEKNILNGMGPTRQDAINEFAKNLQRLKKYSLPNEKMPQPEKPNNDNDGNMYVFVTLKELGM